MTQFKARLAHLMTRRIAVAASIVTLAGAAAGGAAIAVVHGSGPAPAAGRLTASTEPQTPSSTAGAKGGRHRPALALAVVRATAKETGLSPKTIRQDLRAGQTLDQIAGAEAGAVEHDVLAALQARLEKAVAAGRITKDQEAARLATAKTRVEALMSAPIGAQRGKSSASG